MPVAVVAAKSLPLTVAYGRSPPVLVRPVKTTWLVDPRLVPVKLTNPPEPAGRLKPAKVSVPPAAPGLLASVELPAPRVRVPRLSLRAVLASPLTRKVLPFRLMPALVPSLVSLLAPLLSSRTVPPLFTVRLDELAMAPLAPLKASVPPLTTVAPE